MKRFLPAVNFLLLLILGLLVTALLLAVDARPRVHTAAALNDSERQHIEQLLIDNDPRLLVNGSGQTVMLSEGEVNALLVYFLATLPELDPVAARAVLHEARAELHSSVAFPAGPFDGYLNVTLFVEEDAPLRLQRLRVGRLTLPGGLVKALHDGLRPWLRETRNYQLLDSLLATVDSVDLAEGRAGLTLDWREQSLSDISRRASRLFIDEAERQRLLSYYAHIEQIAADLPAGQKRAPLHQFLQPLFRQAEARSGSGGNPVAENRALFIALAVYLNELGLEPLLGPAEGEAYPSPRPLKVVVGTRLDLSQHIVSSAAIAASAGADFADILSIYKEVHDSRHRTGFSFSDITANQVGAALGNLATEDAEHARRLQALLSKSTDESDYMPPVEQFDGISEAEFINRYEDRQSDRYRDRLRSIQAAIATRPVFLAFNNLEFDLAE